MNITKEQPSRAGSMSHLLKRAGLISSETSCFAASLGEKRNHEEAFASKPEVDLRGKTAPPCLSYSCEKQRERD